MWSCDQSLVTLTFLWEELWFYKDLARKTNIFEECCWSKLNNLGPALGMVLTFDTSVAKELKLKVKVLGANSYVYRNYRGKTGREAFLASPILNRVKEALEKWDTNKIESELNENQTKWIFNPPLVLEFLEQWSQWFR